MALSGMAVTMVAKAKKAGPRGLPRRDVRPWPCVASRLSTRASISWSTLARKDSITAFWYSGGSSRWVSAAARISSADIDEIATPKTYRTVAGWHTGENPHFHDVFSVPVLEISRHTG